MIGATLDNHIASFEMHTFIAQKHVNLACQDNRIINWVGAVHKWVPGEAFFSSHNAHSATVAHNNDDHDEAVALRLATCLLPAPA